MAKSFHQTSQHPLPQFTGEELASPDNTRFRLSADDVAFSIAPTEISEIDDGAARFEIIGQPRALRALHMAIRIPAKGYNVFVTGLAGTGKRTAVMNVLEHYRDDTSRVRDHVLVYNFQQPDRPKPLSFAPGRARGFKKAVAELLEFTRERVRLLSEDPQFKDQRDDIILRAEGKENEALREFEDRLDDEGFQMVQVKEQENERTDIAPLYEGEPTSFDKIQEHVNNGDLDESYWRRIREKYYRYMDEMNQIFQRLQVDRSAAERDLKQLRIDAIAPQLRQEIERVKTDYPEEGVAAYLDAFSADILEHLDWFVPENGEEPRDQREQHKLERYDVNILVDNAATEKAPVIFESHPDFHTLFGAQEYSYESGGEPRSSFMMLRAGSLLQASGGFLVLRAEDVLTQEDCWNALKRTLQDGTTEIRNAPGPFSPQSGALKPEPIPVNLKVIIMGTEQLYDLLFQQDEEFGQLFKVPAEFDSVMTRNADTTRQYLGFLRMIVRDESLLPLSYDGMAAILEYAVRLSEFRDKLSTRFSQIADVVREAHYWASRSERGEIDREAVAQTLAERAYLANLPEEKIDEQIQSGELLISVREPAIGRINGLAIVDRGYYAFARPMLITARCAPGDKGIINIERESGLSGEIHDKGVYILEGFLQSRYAKTFPLSVYASICFEQSYIEIDGDSASSAEVYVLLSALAEVPLRQDIAVTGSVNQMGEIQPVGGISEKVEGFFAVCKQSGLTGRQGVIVPTQNRNNLILSHETQQAIRDGHFHIYAVSAIDEGMEILTGIESGRRTQRGSYKSGTINGFVEKRLRDMASQVKHAGSS